MATITYSDTLRVVECGAAGCGITFAMPQSMYRRVRNTGASFYCPNGHRISYTESENTRLKAQLDQAQADARWQREQKERARADAEHERNRVRGYQGALAKSKKRAAKGVCPAPGCKRSFVDIAKHVSTCHPDFTEEA